MHFRLYPNGDVYFQDARAHEPLRFAYVSDFHLPPVSLAQIDPRYHHAIRWWDTAFGDPHTALAHVLDAIQECRVDFVFFGGDILDCFDPATAGHVMDLCDQRRLTPYFQMGNHDFESLHVRYVTHEFDPDERRTNTDELRATWNMPGLDYAFTCRGVRCIALDGLYTPVGGFWGGVLGDAQMDWLMRKLDHDGPIVLFHHVPLDLPTVEHRLRAIWHGQLATLVDDANTARLRDAVADHPNLRGTFAGHTHMRCEDPIGCTWQFITGAGCSGEWRLIEVGEGRPPKSLRVGGEPTVPS